MSSGKPLVWMHGEVKTPPFSRVARVEAGFLLRRLQNGETIDMPASRRMPAIGSNCHELRIDDGDVTWRIFYHIDSDAVVILEVFQKKTRAAPKQAIEVAKKRLRAYQRLIRED
ncbi:MAG: type II toxin-antitoxin system RelE/ParE family toxin [Acidobacteriota bacterium]|nr:type II toxin-antitoxin system RelE/ParE family toxin [Acidobacteriota bacterium]